VARYVSVRNEARNTVLAERCRVASSVRDRTVGLLATPAPGEPLLIERSPSIHMFFMRYPIDVVFLDTHRRVRKVVPGLKPWRVVWWARGARDCLELPSGALEGTDTQVGDQLGLADVPLTSE
jgi:uncharacterized membrane protein (UPF0127 family)